MKKALTIEQHKAQTLNEDGDKFQIIIRIEQYAGALRYHMGECGIWTTDSFLQAIRQTGYLGHLHKGCTFTIVNARPRHDAVAGTRMDDSIAAAEAACLKVEAAAKELRRMVNKMPAVSNGRHPRNVAGHRQIWIRELNKWGDVFRKFAAGEARAQAKEEAEDTIDEIVCPFPMQG